MYIRINKGTPTFEKLEELLKKMKVVHDVRNKFLDKVGAEKFVPGYWTLAGGIASIYFDKQPEGWARAGNKGDNLYVPKKRKSNKELIEEMEKLPRVKYEELNSIVGFKQQERPNPDRPGRGFIKTLCPRMFYRKDYHLMEIEKGLKFKLNEDMVEILESEFIKLEKAK